ncbi:MAG: RecX family transcriptional regulator [Myxococcales bacterium]|nr:RecX family transcriptional regulator [Myxococcales bacterium]
MKKSSKRPCEPLTRDELERAALAYLDRFDSSVTNLRRVLLGHVARAAEQRGGDAAKGGEVWVDELIARYQASGLLNDTRFAATLATGLRRRGSSKQAIVHKLRARGVEEAQANEALLGVDADTGVDAELEAARAFARRRRLGVFRPEQDRRASYRRDLGALARAGFGVDVARRVLGSTENDDEEG